MQTLQTQMARFRIIEWSELDRPTVYRIVDLDNNMIAKVNGPANVQACQKMIDALENCDRMKSLLKNRLKDIIVSTPSGALWVISAQRFLNGGGDLNELIVELKSQAEDNPNMFVRMFSGEALQILQVL